MFTLDASTLYPNNWKIIKNNKVFKIKSCPVYFIFIGQRLGSIKNNILGAIINCWRWSDIEAAKLPKNILGTAILDFRCFAKSECFSLIKNLLDWCSLI